MIKKILLGLLFLFTAIPAALYFGSLDWSKKYSKSVDQLPVFSKKENKGRFRLKVNEFEFVIRTAGMQNAGENVVLLHGFPESSIMWEHVMDSLVAKGYRVMAFDQRGYSPGARPKDIADYQLDKLSVDVISVAKAVGFEQFHLVGHDWGAVVGWNSTIKFPKNIITYTALSIPHLGAFFDGVVNDTLQAKRSGYFKFFQKKYLPEFMFLYAGQKTMKKMLAAMPEQQKAEYFANWAEPGAFSFALNWYRALDVETYSKLGIYEKNITRPTLFIWGTKDQVITESVVKSQEKYMKSNYKSIALVTGHNIVQNNETDLLSALYEQFKIKN